MPDMMCFITQFEKYSAISIDESKAKQVIILIDGRTGNDEIRFAKTLWKTRAGV